MAPTEIRGTNYTHFSNMLTRRGLDSAATLRIVTALIGGIFLAAVAAMAGYYLYLKRLDREIEQSQRNLRDLRLVRLRGAGQGASSSRPDPNGPGTADADIYDPYTPHTPRLSLSLTTPTESRLPETPQGVARRSPRCEGWLGEDKEAKAPESAAAAAAAGQSPYMAGRESAKQSPRYPTSYAEHVLQKEDRGRTAQSDGESSRPSRKTPASRIKRSSTKSRVSSDTERSTPQSSLAPAKASPHYPPQGSKLKEKTTK